MCVPQRGNSLVVVVGGGPDVGDHDGLAVAAQRVLQDACQFRISEMLTQHFVKRKNLLIKPQK